MEKQQDDNVVLRYLYDLERTEFQTFRSDNTTFYSYEEWKSRLYEKAIDNQKGI